MRVRELAKDVGVEPQAVLDLLERTHAAESVTEEEIAKVHELLSTVKPKETPKAQGRKLVRFWSGVRSMAFPVVDDSGVRRLAFFKDFKMVVEEGGIAHKAIVALSDPEVWLIVDKPFEDIGQTARFRNMLTERLKTGKDSEVSLDSGMAFIMALFRNDEQEKAAKALHEYGADGLIELAVKTKSFLGRPYK